MGERKGYRDRAEGLLAGMHEAGERIVLEHPSLTLRDECHCWAPIVYRGLLKRDLEER